MAFLNLTRREIRVQFGKFQEEGFAADSMRVEFALKPAESEELRGALEALRPEEGVELRVDFPQSWTIFFKLREGESRFFLAHPDPESWVATLAISKSHQESILKTLKDRESTSALSSSEPISRMSNLEVGFTFE